MLPSILICIYTILSQSLALVSGYSGQVSLAHAGFYGIGAYSAALITIHFTPNLFITIPSAILITGLLARVIISIAVSTVDDYFIIITLGIQVLVFSLLNNWEGLTNGPLGLVDIQRPTIFGVSLESDVAFFVLAAIVAGLFWCFFRLLSNSPFGRILLAIREDEVLAESFGKDVRKARISSFVISAVAAGCAGVLFSHLVTFIDPSSFTVDESIFILSIVIIGGMDNLNKTFFATVVMVLLPEILKLVGVSSEYAANLRQILYGLLLIILAASLNRSQKQRRKTYYD